MDLFLREATERIGADDALSKIDALMDWPSFSPILERGLGRSGVGPQGYASKANRASLRGKYQDGIMRKAARNRPLRASEKRFNKLISKRRFRVEQCFGTMKRLFGLHRARYFGVGKIHAQLAMAAIGQNLLKAANKITLNTQTRAIA